jgi:hypothetical protein
MALPATDNFNRSNGGLGTNWTNALGTPQISSNTVTGVSNCGAVWNADTPNADCYIIFKLTTISDGGVVDLSLRSTSSSNLQNSYYLEITATAWEFGRLVSDSATRIGASQSKSIADGTVVAFKVVGTTLSASFDGGSTWEGYTQTSSQFNSAGYAGFMVSYSGIVLDDFEVGNTPTATLDQEGFRFRNDDGDETGATWAANQDTNITADAGTKRVRFILNDTGDSSAITPLFEYRYQASGGSFGSWARLQIKS